MLNKNQRIPSKSATKNGKTIHFYEDTHEYIDQDGFQYTSVTQLKKKFFPEFEEEKKALELQERNGTPSQDTLDYWKKLRDIGTTHGSLVHLAAETYLKEGRILKFEKEKTQKCVDLVIHFIDKLKSKYKIVSCEKLVFIQWVVSGQIDLILRGLGDESDTLTILDWKTNKNEISKESFNNEKAYYPIDYMNNSAFWEYTFQMNMYLWIILANNYYPWGKKYKLIIVHIRETGIETHNLDIIPSNIMNKIIDIHMDIPF